MFMSAPEHMDKPIENNDMVSVNAAREMLNAVTKKLDAVKNHKNEQANIRIVLVLNESSSLKNCLRL